MAFFQLSRHSGSDPGFIFASWNLLFSRQMAYGDHTQLGVPSRWSPHSFTARCGYLSSVQFRSVQDGIGYALGKATLRSVSQKKCPQRCLKQFQYSSDWLDDSPFSSFQGRSVSASSIWPLWGVQLQLAGRIFLHTYHCSFELIAENGLVIYGGIIKTM